MASPRDLDPKFKDEKPETVPTEEQEQEQKQDDDTPMIVHRQRITNPDGTIGEKQHGPMPVADWPEYEKEHKL